MSEPVTGFRGLAIAVLLLLVGATVGGHHDAARATRSPDRDAAGTVRYEVEIVDTAHHEARIDVVFAGGLPKPLEVRMSRSSPGRYALHEFAKNVYDVVAEDRDGDRLRLRRVDPHQWNVVDHDGWVKVSYTLFADRADGTYSGIDASHAHLNMPATFLWARGLEGRPITVTFHPPASADWGVATQLVPTDEPFTFTAPDLQYFLDSPTELSDFETRSWRLPFRPNGERGGGEDPCETAADTGAPPECATFRLAVHHRGTDRAVDEFAERIRAVVLEERAVFGELPPFDHGTYTFIADYLPSVHGDGMEHRNSTILTSSSSLDGSALRLLGTVAHELFHAWNVERIRPASLEPFDFEAANMSGDLWFAEGFTSYYDDLILARAGSYDLAAYAGALSRTLSTVTNSPGRRFSSPVGMSQQAPLVDAARWVDPTNRANTFISYYTWGAAVALGLDLSLRTRFSGRDLDGYMRRLWRRHGRPEVPYALEDLEGLLGEYTGDREFTRTFFDRYVRGRDLVDYEPLLASAGLLLRASSPERPTVGRVQLEPRGDGLRVATAPRLGSPLYRAGVGRGDRIVSLAGSPMRDPSEFRRAISAHRPGDRVEVVFHQRGRRRAETLILEADPSLEVVPFESAGRRLTSEIEAFRADWLGSRVAARR